jgi:PilZ domain-containing protein
MIERRTSQRLPRLKAGGIVFNGLSSVIDCTVRNISDGGACLIVAKDSMMPVSFRLRAEGETRSCSVAWRRADRLGVKYQ